MTSSPVVAPARERPDVVRHPRAERVVHVGHLAGRGEDDEQTVEELDRSSP